MTELTAKRLRELFVYQPDTGAFVRRMDMGGRWVKHGGAGKYKAGSIAGGDDGDGYIVIRIDGKLYRANRLAWLYMTGEWPSKFVDHRFGIRSDNRWSSLAEKDPSENLQNSLASKGKAGLIGALWDTRSASYKPQIMVKGKRVHLGTCRTAEQAHAVYIRAKLMLHPGFERERQAS